jgi:hypothetical protein
MSQALEFGAVILNRPAQTAFDGLNRRSLHPMDQLSRRLNWVCTTTTDPLQIAAALESDGVNDRIAREEYGFADVFELAEELYRRVPLRLPETIDPSSEPLPKTLLGLSQGLLVVPLGVLAAILIPSLGQRTITLGVMVALALIWFCGFALYLIKPPSSQGLHLPKSRRRSLRRDWLWVAGFGVLGLSVLLWLPALYWTRNQPGFSQGLLLTLLPLALCMGVLEWSLRRFRRQAARLLAHVSTSAVFITRQRWLFLGWLGVFTACLGLVSLMVWEFVPQPGWIGTRTVPMLITHLALGAGLFSSFLLISRGRVRLVFVPWGVVLIGLIVSSLLRLPHGQVVSLALGAGVLLMVWTFALSWRTLGSVAD